MTEAYHVRETFDNASIVRVVLSGAIARAIMTIIAEFRDASGQTLGGCGWTSPWDCASDAVKSVGRAVSSTASSVGSAVSSAASSAGSAVWGVTKAAGNAIEDAAKWTCSNVLTNSAVQTGAQVATMVPNPYAQGAGYGTMAAGALCRMGYPSGPTPGPVQGLLTNVPPMPPAGYPPGYPFAPTVPTTPSAPPSPHYPAGSFQWQEKKTAAWKIAVPIARTGLGAIPAMPELLWPDVTASEHPYLTAMSRGMLGVTDSPFQVQTAVAPAPGVPVVSQDQGEKDTNTQPVYKTLKFWLIVGSISAAATVGTIAVVRYRRKRL